MSQSYDDNINSLYEKIQSQEEQIDELKDLVAEFQIRLDNIENDWREDETWGNRVPSTKDSHECTH